MQFGKIVVVEVLDPDGRPVRHQQPGVVVETICCRDHVLMLDGTIRSFPEGTLAPAVDAMLLPAVRQALLLEYIKTKLDAQRQ